MRRMQVWINPWITNVTAEAFKLARLCLDNGWLYAAHVQTWKGELLVQLCQPGRQEDACWPDDGPCPYPPGQRPKKRIGRFGPDAP